MKRTNLESGFPFLLKPGSQTGAYSGRTLSTSAIIHHPKSRFYRCIATSEENIIGRLQSISAVSILITKYWIIYNTWEKYTIQNLLNAIKQEEKHTISILDLR